MVLGQDAEEEEEGGPDEAEEEDDEEDDLPCRGVGGGPQVAPVAAIGRGEEVVLDEHRDEKPRDDFAPEQAGVERRDLAGSLAVIVRQTEEDEGADDPEEDGNGDRDGGHGGGIDDRR